MSSTLLLTPCCAAEADAVEARPVRLRDRLTARLRAHTLDRRLADGVPPERTAALTLRARRLLAPELRGTLARSLNRIVRDAHDARGQGGRMPTRTRAVREVAAELQDLARRLVAPEPTAVPGLAQVHLLLTDGTGPLYSPRSGDTLGAAVRRARAALELL